MPVGKAGTDFPIGNAYQDRGVVVRGALGIPELLVSSFRARMDFCVSVWLGVLLHPPRIRAGNHRGYATIEWECWGAS